MGAVTAIISLLLALNQVTGLVQEFRIHHNDFSETMKVGDQQLQRGDYPASFETFKHAVELDPIDREAQNREAQAAMLWLENAHAGDRGFTAIVKELSPTLEHALSRSKGTRAADLMAHIGWANFLRYRESHQDLAIEQSYEQALRIDSGNVYAHAMWGHWILWQHGNLQSAMQHFAAALASGRVRPYVRNLEISALVNLHQPETRAELFRLANDMRRGSEPIPEEDRRRAFQETIGYSFDLWDEIAPILKTVGQEDAAATFDWLSIGDNSGEPFRTQRREFISALLAEIAGKQSEALSKYRSLKIEAQKNDVGKIVSAVDESVKRLSAAKPN